MSDAGTLKKITRHLEDHPGYYHDEEELKFLVLMLGTEKESHQKTAKQLVDIKTHADSIDLKLQGVAELSQQINKDLARMQMLQQEQESLYYREMAEHELLKSKVLDLFDKIKHGDETHQAWLQDTINQHFGI